MVYKKEMFIEIATLEKISDEDIYNVLHKNFKKAFIKIHSVGKVTYRDV